MERLIGTMRREFLDHVLFWNARDLEHKFADFQVYYNGARGHASLAGKTPVDARWLGPSSAMRVGFPTAGAWFSCQWRLDNQFETDTSRVHESTRANHMHPLPPTTPSSCTSWRENRASFTAFMTDGVPDQ